MMSRTTTSYAPNRAASSPAGPSETWSTTYPSAPSPRHQGRRHAGLVLDQEQSHALTLSRGDAASLGSAQASRSSGSHAREATESAFQALMVTMSDRRAPISSGLKCSATAS